MKGVATMRRQQQVDLSGIPMSKGLVKQLFAHLLPARFQWLADLYKDDNEVETSGQAFIAAAGQLLVIVVLSLAYAALIFGLKAAGDYFGNPAISNVILRIGAIAAGVPLFMGLLATLAGFFDLVYFGLFHEKTNTASAGGVKYLKIMFLVLGFVFMLVASTGFIFYIEYIVEHQKKLAALKIEQAEYFEHLDKGRHVWNLYITRTPQHRIDFSYADLSGRDFTGYYFRSVMFDHAILKKAIFDDCYLSGAWFRETDCQGASFKRAYMSEYTHFDGADLSTADFTGAFAEIIAFKVAKKQPTLLDNIESPKKSRWAGISWQSFHTHEWLKKSSYYTSREEEAGVGKMLKEIPPELSNLLKDR
ncbi:MAG TPA: hypothetical protein DCG57_00190 [Candidatus Riflebacteria bacterium]|jgi:hypothetical protein|nr:hypothetical protein [Candidatus Riflebacteria bacterium]